MDQVRVRVAVMAHGEGLKLPKYMTPGAAGMDLQAANDEAIVLEAGASTLVPTGLTMQIPDGYEVQIRPRSGLAFKHAVTVLNSPGTIDSDYRGEVGVLLINLGREPFTIQRGERIAQMIVAPVVQAVWEPVETLDETGRGAGGFGHTGQ